MQKVAAYDLQPNIRGHWPGDVNHLITMYHVEFSCFLIKDAIHIDKGMSRKTIFVNINNPVETILYKRTYFPKICLGSYLA